MKFIKKFSLITGLCLVAGSAFSDNGAVLYKEKLCVACHGVEGKHAAMDAYPNVAGMDANYMLTQMKDIKSGARNNSHAQAMKNIMDQVSDDEMSIIANWLSKQ
jgi:cytochrome c